VSKNQKLCVVNTSLYGIVVCEYHDCDSVLFVACIKIVCVLK
jgi:hypothetical protein